MMKGCSDDMALRASVRDISDARSVDPMLENLRYDEVSRAMREVRGDDDDCSVENVVLRSLYAYAAVSASGRMYMILVRERCWTTPGIRYLAEPCSPLSCKCLPSDATHLVACANSGCWSSSDIMMSEVIISFLVLSIKTIYLVS